MQIGPVKIALICMLVMTGFALSYQQGQKTGFEMGCEWALIQAEVLARESGVFMPVYLKDGSFRVIIRQPRGLYRRAWQAADQADDARLSLPVGIEEANAAPVGENVGSERIDLADLAGPGLFDIVKVGNP